MDTEISKIKKILLVEDDSRDLELTLAGLEENHLANKVAVARDGAEALDYLFATGAHAGRDASVVPQLVLLDLGLPRVGGLDVLKRIRGDERTRLVPVVVLTSSKEEEDVVKSYSLGANGYVRKPVEFPALSDVVRALGLFWLLVNEIAPPRS